MSGVRFGFGPEINAQISACAREIRIDRAVRRFLAEHYPVMGRTWLKNRAAWGSISLLDLKAIRAAYAEDRPYRNQFMGW